VSFTGSVTTGAKIQAACAARNIRCQAEMGGKNVVIVADDADLDRAATLTAAGAFRYAGQKCTATSRVIVDKQVMRPFLEKLERATHALKLGPLSDPAAVIGPMVTREARDRVQASLTATPAETAFEGVLPDGPEWLRGNWLVPRALRINDPAHPAARDELFAPVLAVLQADGFDEAITLANDTRYGLSASLFTRDITRAFHYIRAIDVGLIRVNGDTTGVDPHAPFGGTKASSSGSREQGRAARDFYTEIRTIQVHA
jgi:aldehyde dehydrogenase (NAD+)